MAPNMRKLPNLRSWSAFSAAALIIAVLPVTALSADAADSNSDPGPVKCTITGTPGDDILSGGPGADVLCGRGGEDRLRGGGGDDVLRGGLGDDRLLGRNGDDELQGGRGDDVLIAGLGDDALRGGRGDDTLHGLDGARFHDDLRCGPGGADRALADANDDVASSCEKPVTNGSPTDLSVTPAMVAENSAVGTQVGLLSVTDPDADDTHTLSVVPGTGDSDNSSFTIAGQRLLTAKSFDFEADPSLSVRVRATDSAGASYDEVLTVSVTDVGENGAPVAVDDTFSTPEDTTLVLPVSGPGSPAANDQDSDPLSVTDVSGASGGTVTLTAGTIRFNPAADRCGSSAGSFSYTVSDGRGGTAVGRVSVNVTCVPDNPAATDDTATRSEDDAVSAIPVLANDTDADGDALTISSVTQPANGTVAITGGGTGLTYEPDAGYCNNPPGNAADTFTYTLTPGGATATVAVTVICRDDAPVAVDDTATMDEDAAATEIGVLANDTDVDAGPKNVVSVTDAANGTTAVTNTGVSYTPDANYCNSTPGAARDSFTYELNGGSTATVRVTVTCVQDAPVAAGDTATVSEDTAASPVDVLANDSDVDGGVITIQSVTQPANGSVVITPGSSGVSYVPNANYCNAGGNDADTFTYQLNGGSVATVRVTVTCVDDAPVAVDDDATVAEDASATAIAVRTNDTDIDAGTKSIVSTTQPADGTVAITGSGTGLTYKPDANYCNDPGPAVADTFDYTLNGGSTATVSVTVTCVDDAPVAVDDVKTVIVDATATAVDVLANDTDIDGGPTSVASVTQPTNGTVVRAADGSGLTYKPSAAYCNSPGAAGADTFTYTLNGGSTATVSVTVTCDTVPSAENDTTIVLEDATATTIDVLANDTDPDGGPKSVVSVTQPANGSVLITTGGAAVRYAPNANYCNRPPGTTADVFDYTVNGGSTATVSVMVTCVDDDPVAKPDSLTVAEDSGATAVSPLANDTDIDGGPKDVASVTQPTNGSVVITGGGTGLTYAPNANYCNNPPGTALDTFTYTVNGGSTATVTMTVTCVNDAPVADDDTFVGAIGNTTLIGDDPTDGAPTVAHISRTITADLIDGDADVDGPESLSVTAGTFSTNGGGSVVLEADGDFTFTPAPGCATSDFFDYTVSDGAAVPATDTGRVTLTISDCVWYVHNSSAGNAGTSAAPFDSLAQAETGSAANHTIYVFDGDNTTTGYAAGIDLKAGQRLLGEAADLQVGSVLLRSGVSAARPTITDTLTDVVVLASDNTVRGIQVDPHGGGGIAGGAGDTSGTIHDVLVTDTGTAGTRPGLELSGTSGTWNISGLTVQNGGSSTAIGIRLANAGIVNLTEAVGSNTVTTTGAKALDLSGSTTNLGTASVVAAVTVTGSSSGAVSLVNTVGTISLGDGNQGDLSLTGLTGATAAFLLSSAGNVTVPAGGTSNVSITGGPAIEVTGTAGATLSFDDVDSTNSTTDGINIAGLGSGSFSAGTGSTVAGATGVGFDLAGGSGSVTYDGTITHALSELVRVQNTTGGLKDFNGAINDTIDGGGGISLLNNPGALVRFDGGVTVRTTTNPAFAATGGGTVAVVDPIGATTNTLQTTTGIPLNVANTTIHDDDLTFERISSNGATNGIVLDTTTNAGGRLVVAGAGGACTVTTTTCTGGSILASTGPGVSLTNVPGGVTLATVRVANGLDDGIRATSVVDVDLTDAIVTANGNSHVGGLEERGLDYLNVTGTPQILRTAITGSDDSNAHIRNTVAGTTTLNVNASTFSDSKNNAGLRVRGEGPSVMTATVQASFFSLNADPGFSLQTDSANTAQQTLLFNNNEVSGGSTAAVPARPQVSINSDSASVVKVTVSNNKIKSAAGAELILNTLPNHTGTFDAMVVNNVINDAQPGALDSPTDGGPSIWGWAHGDGVTRMEIRSNTVAGSGIRALELSHNDGNGAADYTVTDNIFGRPDATVNSFEGIYIHAGGATGDTSNVCVDLERNDMDGIGNQGFPDIALDRFGTAQLRFADFNDTVVANLQTNLRGKNPASAALTVDTYGFGPTATTATTCNLTTGTP